MKINHLNIIVFILLGCLLGGCKKQLNVLPSTQEVDGNIITDQQSALTALNGVYYRFAHAGNDFNGVPSTFWYDVNEEIPSLLSGMVTNPLGSTGLDAHTYTSTTWQMDSLWAYGYAIVNAANGFLKNIEPVQTITSSTKNEMIAEARFLRAFGNSELLLYFGQYNDTTSSLGIILQNEFVTPADLQLPRSPVAASYDTILSDLDRAIPDLPSTNTTVAYTNSWAAKLLKARVLINRGSAADYTEVISLTQDIIANGPFSLQPNLQDLFWIAGLTSPEVILGVQPYSTQLVKWKDYIYYVQYGSSALMDTLLSGDPRSAWEAQTINSAYGTYPAVTKYYPGSITTIAWQLISENCYAFRLTESYLLEAEAIVASGGALGDARTLLKTVLGHAGVTNFTAVDAAATPAALQLQIIEEEMRNFVLEAGQDWFAVRRLPFTTLQNLLPTVTSKSLLLLPIPDAEMTANSKMVQNPNY